MVNGDELTPALARLAPPGIRLGYRIITVGDEDELRPGEAMLKKHSSTRARRQSGAARMVARRLLAEFGLHHAVIASSPRGIPTFPAGFVGSLAHDRHFAVAAVARNDRFLTLGIDIEPAEPLPAELVDAVATPYERRRYSDTVLKSRVLFAVKEATYKAVNPQDGRFIDFQDVAVDLLTGKACIREGTTVDFVVGTAPRIVALAYVRAG